MNEFGSLDADHINMGDEEELPLLDSALARTAGGRELRRARFGVDDPVAEDHYPYAVLHANNMSEKSESGKIDQMEDNDDVQDDDVPRIADRQRVAMDASRAEMDWFSRISSHSKTEDDWVDLQDDLSSVATPLSYDTSVQSEVASPIFRRLSDSQDEESTKRYSKAYKTRSEQLHSKHSSEANAPGVALATKVYDSSFSKKLNKLYSKAQAATKTEDCDLDTNGMGEQLPREQDCSKPPDASSSASSSLVGVNLTDDLSLTEEDFNNDPGFFIDHDDSSVSDTSVATDARSQPSDEGLAEMEAAKENKASSESDQAAPMMLEMRSRSFVSKGRSFPTLAAIKARRGRFGWRNARSTMASSPTTLSLPDPARARSLLRQRRKQVGAFEDDANVQEDRVYLMADSSNEMPIGGMRKSFIELNGGSPVGSDESSSRCPVVVDTNENGIGSQSEGLYSVELLNKDPMMSQNEEEKSSPDAEIDQETGLMEEPGVTHSNLEQLSSFEVVAAADGRDVTIQHSSEILDAVKESSFFVKTIQPTATHISVPVIIPRISTGRGMSSSPLPFDETNENDSTLLAEELPSSGRSSVYSDSDGDFSDQSFLRSKNNSNTLPAPTPQPAASTTTSSLVRFWETVISGQGESWNVP